MRRRGIMPPEDLVREGKLRVKIQSRKKRGGEKKKSENLVEGGTT